jgi:Raf kinase inhibitor-like YbhB/YbcL family protein
MRWWLLLALIIIAWLAGCANKTATPTSAGTGTLAKIEITSPAFAAGEAIPKVYSCQGEDRSPAVAWSEPPQGTQSLAMILDDPDAPGGIWVHWVVYNLPPNTRGLAKSASIAKGETNLPQGALPGKNSWSRLDYGGPCPPTGTHHYIFHLYALDISIPQAKLDKAGLLKAMDGHILGKGELMGTYAK